MAVICLDIDNIVARTDEVMRQVIHEHSEDRVDLAYDDVVCFDYWMCRDASGRRLGKREWSRVHEEFTRNHLLRISPYENAKGHLGRIGEKCEVHLATSRLPEGQSQTLAWLAKHEIPYHRLHFVRHGEKHLINHHFVAVVEDDREQAYAFHAKGVRVFLLAHPWNHVGPHSPLIRVPSWEDLTREILDLTV